MHSTATPPITAAPAVTVQYDSGPSGDIFVSEAALGALARTRKWLLLLAIALFVYAGVGGLGGAGMLFVAITEGGGEADFEAAPFYVIGITNLVFALLALVGGIYLMRFWSAAGLALRLRRPEDMDRVLIAQHRVWRFACIVLVAVLALPFMLVALLIATGGWN